MALHLNVLNYFKHLKRLHHGVGGASKRCRGADNARVSSGKSQKTVAAAGGWSAAVVGLRPRSRTTTANGPGSPWRSWWTD